MIIAVRKEQNDTIYIDKEIFYRVDNKGLFVFEEERLSQPPYNFKKIIISDDYSDCSGEDFNEDLTFSVEKYNARKQRENKLNYKKEVERLISLRYDIYDELAIQRQKDVKPDEFAEYNAYVEQCKAEVKNAIN